MFLNDDSSVNLKNVTLKNTMSKSKPAADKSDSDFELDENTSSSECILKNYLYFILFNRLIQNYNLNQAMSIASDISMASKASNRTISKLKESKTPTANKKVYFFI
jgi:hypothetical protein